MDIELANKVNELIDLLNNSDTIEKIDSFKEKINSSVYLKGLINDFNNAKQSYFSTPSSVTKEKLIHTKSILYNNEIIKEYKSAINELNNYILIFNNKLNLLLKQKSCEKKVKE